MLMPKKVKHRKSQKVELRVPLLVGQNFPSAILD